MQNGEGLSSEFVTKPVFAPASDPCMPHPRLVALFPIWAASGDGAPSEEAAGLSIQEGN